MRFISVVQIVFLTVDEGVDVDVHLGDGGVHADEEASGEVQLGLNHQQVGVELVEAVNDVASDFELLGVASDSVELRDDSRAGHDDEDDEEHHRDHRRCVADSAFAHLVCVLFYLCASKAEGVWETEKVLLLCSSREVQSEATRASS